MNYLNNYTKSLNQLLKRTISMLLVCSLLMSLIPMTVFAVEPENVLDVGTAEQLKDAFTLINSSEDEEYIINLSGDVLVEGDEYNDGFTIDGGNEVTILGNDHKIITKIQGDLFKVIEGSTINLGASDYDKSLTVEGTGNEANIMGATFFISGADSTLNMYDNVTLTNFSINDNSDDHESVMRSVIHARNGGTINLYGGEISDNYSDSGAVSARDSYINIDSEDILFKNNTTKDMGGAIYAQNSELSIIGATFENNTAESGGAISVIKTDGTIDGSINIDNTSFENNEAKENNEGDGGYGGAIYILVRNNSTLNTVINNSTFDSNKAVKEGGAISNWMGSVLKVTNSTFENNSLPSGDDPEYPNWGGAIDNYKATLISIGNKYIGNKADEAGAIINAGDPDSTIGTALISGDEFDDNYAYLWGGALSNINGTLTINNSNIHDNFAKNIGGAIVGNSNSTIISNGNVYTQNGSTEGGAIYNHDIFVSSGDEIYENFAFSAGGGVYEEGTGDYSTSLVYGNTADTYGIGGSDFYITEDTTSIKIMDASLFNKRIEIPNHGWIDVDGWYEDYSGDQRYFLNDVTPKVSLDDIVAGSKDYALIAANTPTPKYKVSFLNYDGSLIYSGDVKEGVTPTYRDDLYGTPTKSGDNQYTYEFTGWDPELAPASGDIDYTATFEQSIRKYTVVFGYFDDEWIILQSGDVAYGDTPIYSGANPTRPDSGDIAYIFDRWDPEAVPVTGPNIVPGTDIEIPTIYQAVFNEVPLEKYDLWVGETRVTNGNASNVLGNDTVVYDANTNTLTLNGATITGAEVENNSYGIKYAGDDEFTIVANGNSTITTPSINIDDNAGGSAGILISKYDVGDWSGYGSEDETDLNIIINDGATLNIYTGDVIGGMYPSNSGITFWNNFGSLTITGSGDLNITGGQSDYCYGIYSDKEINLSSTGRVTITEPDDTLYNMGLCAQTITIDDGTININAGNTTLSSYAIYAMIDWMDGSKGDLTINSGDITLIAGNVPDYLGEGDTNGSFSYAICCDGEFKLNGGNLEAKTTSISGDNVSALNKEVILADGIVAGASTDSNGNNAVIYNQDDNDTYKWFKVPFEYIEPTIITSVIANIEIPNAGDKVTVTGDFTTQSPKPNVTIPEDANYFLVDTYWYTDPSTVEDYIFSGEFVAGETYYAILLFGSNNDEYIFSDETTITINSGDLIPNVGFDAEYADNTISAIVTVSIPAEEIPSGDSQSGDSQSGDSQSGDSQSGDSQSGDSQSGDSQSGDNPSGGNSSGGKSSGGGSSSSSYKVITKTDNAKVTPDITSIKKGTSQEFKFSAEEGYEITDVLIDGKSIGAVDSYTLENVKEKHTIEIKTEKITAITNVDDWAKEEMAKAKEKGLVPETFIKKDATKPISRSEFAAVAVKLYEALTGKKAEKAQNSPFVDINDDYVSKAYALGITVGISETEFGDAPITREQMATMISRTLSKVGIDVSIDLEKVTRFADDNLIHDWARPSVYYMSSKEIIKGIGDNKFDPLGNAKVEEALAIALRCTEFFNK